MIRRPPRSTQSRSSAASDVYKRQGWLYLATVIDCHTKAVIGWAMDDNYKTPLISAAIDMAVRNHSISPQAIFHSDRGSNYTSAEFAATLTGHNMRHSVGRTGIC